MLSMEDDYLSFMFIDSLKHKTLKHLIYSALIVILLVILCMVIIFADANFCKFQFACKGMFLGDY